MSRSFTGQVFMRRHARIVMAAVLALGFMASIGVTDAHATEPQATLIITNATRTATVGASVTLTSSGGTGSGATTYVSTTVSGAGCTVTLSGGVSTLTAAGASTCSVVATKAASGNYAAISSPALRFWFITASAALLPQAPLRISNTTRSVATSSSITLTITGGTTGGAVTYVASPAACVITGAVLTVTQATACTVVATMAGDATYASVSSTALYFIFTVVSTLQTQAPLLIANTTRSALTSQTITLTTSGGSSSASVSYSYSGTGCSLPTSTTLAASQATICTVTATKAADSTYASVTSPPLYFTFTVGTTLLPQLPLVVSNTTRTATVGSTITLTSSGGTGNGVVTFAYTGTYCSITAGVLSASQAATCLVTATKPSDGTYASKTSPALQFRFNAA
jgi:trimeric autotransporter adhesin